MEDNYLNHFFPSVAVSPSRLSSYSPPSPILLLFSPREKIKPRPIVPTVSTPPPTPFHLTLFIFPRFVSPYLPSRMTSVLLFSAIFHRNQESSFAIPLFSSFQHLFPPCESRSHPATWILPFLHVSVLYSVDRYINKLRFTRLSLNLRTTHAFSVYFFVSEL